MLTKEQIESMHTLLVRERPMGTSVAAVDELCRLALLGLERDNDRERVRKDFAEELVASMESNIRNGEAVVAMGIDSNDQSLMREGRLRELAAMFVREMVLACRFKDKLGLERDERQAVTSEQAAKDIKILEQIHAKSWDEAVALRHAAEALSERDERAERVGRAVLLSFGYAPFTYYKWADALERHTLVTPARLLRAISDALEEP